MAKQPDYKVSAMDTSANLKNFRLGGAWTNPDGTIDVKLDPFVVLTGGPDLLIRLWPNDRIDRGTKKSGDVSINPPSESEIPF